MFLTIKSLDLESLEPPQEDRVIDGLGVKEKSLKYLNLLDLPIRLKILKKKGK